MGKFCKKCGYQFKGPGKFCPGCGAVREGEESTANIEEVPEVQAEPVEQAEQQVAPQAVQTPEPPQQPRPMNYQQVPPQVPPQMNYQQVPPQQMSYQQMPASNSNNAWKIAAIVVVLGVLVGIGYTFLNKSKDTQEAPPVATQTEEQTQAPVAAPPAPKVETYEEKIAKTQQYLKNKGLARTVVATSMGHNPNGYLAMVLKNNYYEFAICDTKNDRVVTVEAAPNLSEIAQSHSQQDKSVTFTMFVYNDTHDKDVKAGEWDAQTHIIPIKAVYAYDANGNIIDHGIYTQNNTMSAYACSEYLYETKNVETVNILLTEMQALYDTAAKNNVRLP